jgi:hypothetical protein
MSVEKIIASALANNPMQMKKEFAEEMRSRIEAALESKYQDMMEAADEDDEDEDEEENDMDDNEDDEDEDEDDEDLDEKKRK